MNSKAPPILARPQNFANEITSLFGFFFLVCNIHTVDPSNAQWLPETGLDKTHKIQVCGKLLMKQHKTCLIKTSKDVNELLEPPLGLKMSNWKYTV